jgi:hypothetical protein
VARLCLNVTAIYSWIDVVSKFGACHEPFKLTRADLPDLVTFDDVNDPSSILLVDPNNLQGALGPGVSLAVDDIANDERAVDQGD